jgi:hypothetical protein
MNFGIHRFLRGLNERHGKLFVLVLSFCCIPFAYAGGKVRGTANNTLLMIETVGEGRVLWQYPVKEGDEILHQYVHSVYGDKVYETYRVTSGGALALVKVKSSPLVLYTIYPGFELPSDTGEKSGDLVEVRMNKQRENLVMTVGGDVTDNRLTVGRQRVKFKGITGDGAVIRIYLRRAAMGEH